MPIVVQITELFKQRKVSIFPKNERVFGPNSRPRNQTQVIQCENKREKCPDSKIIHLASQ